MVYSGFSKLHRFVQYSLETKGHLKPANSFSSRLKSVYFPLTTQINYWTGLEEDRYQIQKRWRKREGEGGDYHMEKELKAGFCRNHKKVTSRRVEVICVTHILISPRSSGSFNTCSCVIRLAEWNSILKRMAADDDPKSKIFYLWNMPLKMSSWQSLYLGFFLEELKL